MASASVLQHQLRYEEHCSANAEAMGSNPVEAPKTFFELTLRLFKSQSQLWWSYVCISYVVWGPFLEIPEKPLVKLRPAYSVKLVFSYVVKGIKIKITAKFRAFKRLRFEDTKRISPPEMRPKSFGTFEKRASGLAMSMYGGAWIPCDWYLSCLYSRMRDLAAESIMKQPYRTHNRNLVLR